MKRTARFRLNHMIHNCVAHPMLVLADMLAGTRLDALAQRLFRFHDDTSPPDDAYNTKKFNDDHFITLSSPGASFEQMKDLVDSVFIEDAVLIDDRQKYYVGSSPAELTPDQAVALFESTPVEDWLYDADDASDDMPTLFLSCRGNMLLTLQLMLDHDGSFFYQLVYGYQPIASVSGPGGRIISRIDYDVVRL